MARPGSAVSWKVIPAAVVGFLVLRRGAELVLAAGAGGQEEQGEKGDAEEKGPCFHGGVLSSMEALKRTLREQVLEEG
jgi:hypothetical protein